MLRITAHFCLLSGLPRQWLVCLGIRRRISRPGKGPLRNAPQAYCGYARSVWRGSWASVTCNRLVRLAARLGGRDSCLNRAWVKSDTGKASRELYGSLWCFALLHGGGEHLRKPMGLRLPLFTLGEGWIESVAPLWLGSIARSAWRPWANWTRG